MNSSQVPTCQYCGCTEIDSDPGRGDSVCTSCGAVLESQMIVNEVQFEKGSSGVLGSFVHDDDPMISAPYAGGSAAGSNEADTAINSEYREAAFRKARDRLQQMASELKIKQHCVDSAHNMYKMCCNRGYTKGRPSDLVYATVLYIICRLEPTTHMMIDFSDILGVNVYQLGSLFQHFARSLHIKIPVMDPAIYINRFAAKLQLGERTNQVALLANRVVQRMKRDWITAGRRPTGLCGAALLVAARYFGFNRSPRDIIKSLKVGRATLERRLTELAQTPSAKLTVQQFNTIDLEEEADPPCYTAARKNVKTAKTQEMLNREKLLNLVNEAGSLENEMNAEIESWQARRSEAFLSRLGRDEQIQFTEDETQALQESGVPVDRWKELDFDEPTVKDDGTDVKSTEIPSTSSSIPSSSPPSPPSTSTVAEKAKDGQSHIDQSQLSTEELSRLYMAGCAGDGDDTTAVVNSVYDPIASCLYYSDRESAEKLSSSSALPTSSSSSSLPSAVATPNQSKDEKVESAELDLTGIDDAEIDEYILSKDESRVKTLIWMKANAQYLKEKAEWRRMQEQLRQEQGEDGARGRRKRTKKTGTVEVKKSDKINYEKLANSSADVQPAEAKKDDLPKNEEITIKSAASSSISPSPSPSSATSLSSLPSISEKLLSSPVKRKSLFGLISNPSNNLPTVDTIRRSPIKKTTSQFRIRPNLPAKGPSSSTPTSSLSTSTSSPSTSTDLPTTPPSTSSSIFSARSTRDAVTDRFLKRRRLVPTALVGNSAGKRKR